jgi:hypothetical protein
MTRKPSPAASKKRESEQRKERELFSWHSPFPLGGESERTFFAFFTLHCSEDVFLRQAGDKKKKMRLWQQKMRKRERPMLLIWPKLLFQ